MAALCPGVKYGLSSQESYGENKDLIFVKLTDSSLRAIEDFLKNQNKLGYSSPTIKFLGNEGQLSFPSVRNGNGCTSFKFTLSTTADMERPGGSFECLQQRGNQRSPLSVLGPIPYKMQIHANEDVYEATKHRMTVAEENHKNKCTREIKPNQNDIGKKVKVKQTRPLLPLPSRKDSPMREPKLSPYHPNVPSKAMNGNGLSNGNGYVGGNLQQQQQQQQRPPQNKPSVPDIARRPIKERLIHLLALRPFKKPELFERLNREGLREKNSVTVVLKQISSLKDNSYHLNRAMWNDVREDWPFYTESERQALRRRKPQNLTPPGSSDGGSSSGGCQSPTSTHPGSPPSSSTAVTTSTKRPGYYDGADGLPTKRQRISHYRKPPTTMASSAAPPPAETTTTTMTRGVVVNGKGGEDVVVGGNCDLGAWNGSPAVGKEAEVDGVNETAEVVVSSTQNRFGGQCSSPDSQSDRIVSGSEINNSSRRNEFPDYLREYTTIKNQEQRRAYKEHFTADYAEYRRLHGIVEEVSNRFAELEEKLQETRGTPEHKNIKKKIFVEYLEKKRDKEHQRAKQRFQYLHDKLSHIKRLVLEYDEKNAPRNGKY